jgi:uncharacterized protein YbbC (DUF1343 family)
MIKNKNSIILTLFLILILFFGCQSKREKQEVNKTTKELFEEYFKLDSEKIALLAIKYEIEEIKVENILTNYLSKHDILYGILFQEEKAKGQESYPSMKDRETEQNFQETLEELSKKYDIPKVKLAGLIIDYKIWTECEKGKI